MASNILAPSNWLDPEEPVGFKSYANPFRGLGHQYLPYHNMDAMLWWANHFLLRFGFYRAALSRIANYFITGITIKDVSSSEDRKKYERAFQTINWKEILFEAGFNLLAYSNLFMSVVPGFNRYLECPKCGGKVHIQNIDDYEFTEDAQFIWQCPNKQCRYKGPFKVHDLTSSRVQDITIRIWPPREIYIEEELVTKKRNYYWRIPEAYKHKIFKSKTKFYSKHTPMVVFEAAKQNKMVQLEPVNFIHIALPTPAGLQTGGKSIPLAIYLFDEFFLLKTL